MSETSPHSEAIVRHNPFDDPKPKRRPGTIIALLLAIIVHGALGVYLWKTRFEPKYKEYSDEVTDVDIIKPVPPPPPPEPPRPSVITQPDWTRRPTGEDFARYYPDRALRMEVEGRVSMSCQVSARGTLEGCSISSEDPGDMGFGEAALKMSRLFKMRPQTKDGQPVGGGTVRIPIRFQIPK